MTSGRAPAVFTGLLLACLHPIASLSQSPVIAQSGTTASATPLVAERSASPPDEIRLPVVSVSAAPRTYQVVSIPIPEVLADAGEVQVVIEPKGDFVVLGARTRTISISRGDRQVSVTIGIPARSLAGRQLAAEAHFILSGSPNLIVPIEIDVGLVRSVVLSSGKGPLNAQAGSDVVLPLAIANAGNSLERLTTALTLPRGWSSYDPQRSSAVVSPGETISHSLRLKIPARANTGSWFVNVGLLAGADTVAAQTIRVEVFNTSSIARRSGPFVTTAYSRATDENGNASDLFALTANGALYDSVRLDAHISVGPPPAAAATYGMAHLGSYYAPWSLSLTAPAAQLSFGNTGTSFSDLTGLYTYGQGGLLSLQRRDWDLLALAALSLRYLPSSDRKPMLGLGVGHRLGMAHVSGSISHLADAGPAPRQLDAIGIGVAVPAFFATTLRTEIAERRYESGDGIGWSAALLRANGGNNAQLRMTHAPGGADAYARATDEVQADFAQRITSRMLLSASAWKTADETSVFSSLESNGASLRPQYTLFGSTSIAVEARSYFYEVVSRPTGPINTGAFSNREQQLGLSLATYLGRYYLLSSAYLGNVERTNTPIGQITISDRVPRNYWTTNAGRSAARGFLELQMRIEQTRSRAGSVLQQNLFGARGEQVVSPWLGGIRVMGELQRVDGFGDNTSSVVRAGLAVPLFSDLALKIAAERNSIFHSLDRRVPWLFAVRFEHFRTVPMLRTPGTSGYVYRDLNANQRRDDGEPGIAHAIVKRGAERAVTDATGQYRVGGDGGKAVTIDELSLPEGWSADGAGAGDIGVTLSGSKVIEFVVAQRPGLKAVYVDLTKVRLIVRDSVGREWTAIMTGPSTAMLQSLPVGTYRLELDLSALNEPLIPRAPLPPLIITGTDAGSITIILDPRPVRMWDGGSRGPSGRSPR